MATRYITRALLSTTKPMTSVLSHSYHAAAVFPNSPFILRLRPLVAAVSASCFRRLAPAISSRSLATRQTSSSLNDPNPNWSNRPPKETILLDGCDFEHWLVVMEPPEGGDTTRDDIIDGYIKTLASVVGSEEEARMKIYSVSTRHYFAFGALVSEELSYKLKELPKVRWVLPDSYMDVKNKDYGGEPFINGQAAPYDARYHEEWVRNNSRANERNRRNDRPRNFDRSRNFERRREMIGGSVGGGPGGGGNMGPPPPNAPNSGGMQPNYGGGMPQNNNPTGNYPPRGPPANNNEPNYYAPNSGPAPYQPSPGPVGPGQGPNQNNAYAPNMGGGNPYQDQTAPTQAPNRGYGQGQNAGGYAPNAGYAPDPNQNNYGQSQNGYGQNGGPGQGQNQGGYGNPSPNQNVLGRDPNY